MHNLRPRGRSFHIVYGDDPPEDLGSIAVFDRYAARLSLTDEQEVAYLPYGLDIVETLANTVLPELDRRLEADLAAIDTGSEQFSHLIGDTDVGKLVATLSHKTDLDYVRKLGTLSEPELEKLEQLNRTLEEADPAAKARELRLSAARLKELAGRVGSSVAHLDDEAVKRIREVVQEATKAREAEAAAVATLHTGDALLPGTGEAVWKALYAAARKFSVEQAYSGADFPNTEDGAVCVFCQQPLGDAAERLKRFETYVQDDVAKTVTAKQMLLDQAIDSLRSADLTMGIEGAVAGELDLLDETVCSTIEAFEKGLDARRAAVLEAVDTVSWEAVPEMPLTPRKVIRDLAAKQLKSARAYGKVLSKDESPALRKERECLAARKALSLCLTPFFELLGRKKRKHALSTCKGDLNTRPISMKSRELASEAVTSALRDALDEELRGLGMGHINTALKSRNVKGKILHRLVLDIPTSDAIKDILSEGEQRAIALGAFLAELRLAEHSAAIVLDDPVSSLDHKCRARLAKRLAMESRNRQVIVFTHEIHFLCQLQNQCANLGPPPGLRFLERIGVHCGFVADGLPWGRKSYKERIHHLEQAQKRFERLPWPAEPSEVLAREMIQQYSFLRATIERVVQDFVLNRTVMRFDDYIRIKNLDRVVGLQESEVAEIQRQYQRCHGIVEAHDPASDDPPPSAEEFGEDIDALRAIIQTIRDRRRA